MIHDIVYFGKLSMDVSLSVINIQLEDFVMTRLLSSLLAFLPNLRK
jgi:hypothetical protein